MGAMAKGRSVADNEKINFRERQIVTILNRGVKGWRSLRAMDKETDIEIISMSRRRTETGVVIRDLPIASSSRKGMRSRHQKKLWEPSHSTLSVEAVKATLMTCNRVRRFI